MPSNQPSTREEQTVWFTDILKSVDGVNAKQAVTKVYNWASRQISDLQHQCNQ